MATKIQGIDGLTHGELRHQIDLGGRFVFYKYTISAVVITFRRSSGIYLVRLGESRVVKGLGWTALTLLLGWWGIPWGPIFSIGSLWTNLHGGVDVTLQVMNSLGFNENTALETPPPMPPSAPPSPGSY